jgi:hypothetical protein
VSGNSAQIFGIKIMGYIMGKEPERLPSALETNRGISEKTISNSHFSPV